MSFDVRPIPDRLADPLRYGELGITSHENFNERVNFVLRYYYVRRQLFFETLAVIRHGVFMLFLFTDANRHHDNNIYMTFCHI